MNKSIDSKHFPSNKLSITLIFIFFISLFVYIAGINLLTPLMSDDFVYTNVTSEKLNLWGLIARDFQYTSSSYLHWGGRIFTDSIEYSGIMGTTYFNIGNAIVFCFFIYAIFLCSNLRKPTKFADLVILVLITASVWFSFNELSEVSFWKTGSSYLWTITATLYIIYPFLRLYDGTDIISSSILKTIILTLAALLLGAGLEHLSVATSLLFIFITGFYYWKNKNLPKWTVIVTIAYIIGTVILLASPGSYVRYASEAPTATSHFSIILLLKKIYPMTIVIAHHYLIESRFLFSFLFLVALLVFLIPLKHSLKAVNVAVVMLFMVGLAAFALIGAPGIRFVARGTFFSDTFFVISMFSVISKANQCANWRRILNAAAIIAFICLAYNMLKNYQDMLSFHRQVQERERLIAFYVKKQVPMAYIPAYYFDRFHYSTYPTHSFYVRHIDYDDIYPDQVEAAWVNQSFAKYYNLNQVQLTPFVEFVSSFDNIVSINQTKSGFSLYIRNKKLFFVNRQHFCSEIQNKNNFLVRVYPKNRFSLSFKDMLHGYYDVNFTNYENQLVTVLTSDGQIANDLCVLAIHLPNYPISHIETYQK